VRNPYTVPLRLHRQRLDQFRREIAERLAEQSDLAARVAALATQAREEAKLRTLDAPAGEPWFAWQRRTRGAFQCNIAALDEQIAVLRDQLREELARIAALEEAERRLLARQRRQAERRAQAVADDRAAALHGATAA